MYHSIDGLRHLGPSFRGLLHPSVADTLSNCLTIGPDNKHTLRWNGEEHEIPQIEE
jgi:hypothetical protein